MMNDAPYTDKVIPKEAKRRYFSPPKIKTNRQKVWEYIRRNRNFRIGDLLLIFEIPESTLRTLIRQLLRAGYIKKTVSKQAFRDKGYKLIRNTGVMCPKPKGKRELWDMNLNEAFFMDTANA